MKLFPHTETEYEGLRLVTPSFEQIFEIAERIAETPLQSETDFMTLGEWALEKDPGRRFAETIIEGLTHSATNPTAEEWNIKFVLLDTENNILGRQTIRSTDRPDVFGTGSWVFPEHRGKGYGTIMRSLAYELGLNHLGFRAGRSGVYTHNEASAAINKKMGGTVVSSEPRTVKNMLGETKATSHQIWEIAKQSFVTQTPGVVFEMKQLVEVFANEHDM